MNPDGLQAPQAGSNGSTELNLTASLVVCPPLTCITSGCSPIELRRHLFSVKGLQGCGIDTMATEGAQFDVNFWVWDSGTPVLNATASRLLVVTKPCPDASSPHFCTSNDGSHFCSGVCECRKLACLCHWRGAAC